VDRKSYFLGRKVGGGKTRGSEVCGKPLQYAIWGGNKKGKREKKLKGEYLLSKPRADKERGKASNIGPALYVSSSPGKNASK